MSASGASTLIQRVVSSRGVTSYAGRPPAPSGREVFFKLELLTSVELDPAGPTEGSDPFARILTEEKVEQPKLRPGHRYRVRVSTSQHGQAGQQPIYTTASLNLLLCCKDVPEIGIPNAKRIVEPEAIATFDEEFELTISANCPTGSYELKLLSHQNNRLGLAASLSFDLEGTYNPVDSALLTTCRIKLNDQPPEHTAILHIEAPAPGQYRLTGWSRREKPLKTGLMEEPELALANFVEEELQPEHIKNQLASFSRRSPEELLEWFEALEKRHGDRLILIIADHSVSEIPWEMVQWKRGSYIGATWRVVRWIPVRDFRVWQELCLQEEERTGKVLAYLNHEELDTRVEREALSRFATSFCTTTALLKQGLSRQLESVALVYLGCHGVFTYGEKHKVAVGELHNPSNTLVALSVEDIQGPEGARPLLFVNACHSARLIRDSNGFYGLPEVFLARIASAYLGTLGPVGSTYAAEIANIIFTEAVKKSIEPAEVLRRLRAEAVAALSASEATENWLNFIYTFMYVYYGNPFVKIRLGAAEPEGDA